VRSFKYALPQCDNSIRGLNQEGIMFNARERSQPITFFASLFIACLLVAAVATAAPFITLSKKIGPPTSEILVSGRGFKPNAKLDIYFDSKDEALAIADDAGSFSRLAIPTPTSALPGRHWVSAVERSGRNQAKMRFDVHSNWRQFHRLDMVRFNRFENVLNVHNVGNLALKWRYPSGGSVISSPAVADGILYVGSEDTNLYALDARTGAKVWSYRTPGGCVCSSPAVESGVVYFGSDYPDGTFYALNASTGAKLWNVPMEAVASPAVVKGVVFLGLRSGGMDALDASTGVTVWSYATGDVFSSPAVANGMVYFGSLDHNVYAVDAQTGTNVWTYATGSSVSSSPAVANGVVYIGSDDHNLYALDAETGAKLWSYPTRYTVRSAPAVANGVVYVTSSNLNSGDISALNATTGTELWRKTSLNASTSPAVANGVVYFGSNNYDVYALNAQTGDKLWSHATGYFVSSSPAVADGVVYIGSDDYEIYAFGLPDGLR